MTRESDIFVESRTIESAPSHELVELCAHIGNIIRLAAAVELSEVDAACRCVRDGVPGIILDPMRQAESAEDRCRLLAAFRTFRTAIDLGCLPPMRGRIEL